MQFLFQFQEQRLLIRSRLVHLVHEQKHRHLILRQKPKQRPRMRLHTVRPADDKNRVIQYLKRPLHLRRKIHMPRRI